MQMQINAIAESEHQKPFLDPPLIYFCIEILRTLFSLFLHQECCLNTKAQRRRGWPANFACKNLVYGQGTYFKKTIAKHLQPTS